MTDMTSTTRATLLERLHDGGDALAWDDFFARYWPAVYGYARHRGCSEHTAEEIVQDVMLLIFEQRDIYQYDPTRGRFRDWLGTVVRNKIAEHRRRPANRIHGQGGDSNGDRLQQIPDAHEPDDAWESTFENNLLLAILDIVRREINARTYLAFELLAIQEMSGSRPHHRPLAQRRLQSSQTCDRATDRAWRPLSRQRPIDRTHPTRVLRTSPGRRRTIVDRANPKNNVFTISKKNERPSANLPSSGRACPPCCPTTTHSKT
jgi:RNA polymerase sigma-70 factor (ECF subfamily)